mmetsp:Transcript_921/g.2064  ORF Transcript_921/g.2064 Transcript_921/m.2064 type:complete len:155 (-) Transcript_921:22-486(-)
MGLKASKPLPRLPVPEGMTRICVAGFGISHHTGRARRIADGIASVHPEKYETWYYFDTFGFRPEFLDSVKAELSEEQRKKFADHKSSPFCWLERSDGTKNALGGRDRLCDWVRETFKDDERDESFLSLTREEPTRQWKEVKFDNKTPGTAKTVS